MSKNLNLGRTLRLGAKSAVINSASAVMNTKPVRKVSSMILTAYLKNKAAIAGRKVPYVTQFLAFIFDMACLPITWCVVLPMMKIWEVIKHTWQGAKVNRALPAK